MKSKLKALFDQAIKLSEDERATLAGLLLEGLESGPDTGVDEAWAEEIGRRVRELKSGEVKDVPWETVRAELLKRLNDS